MTVRRRAHHGQGEALPCPGARRRDGGRGYVRALRGKGGFETRPYVPLRNLFAPYAIFPLAYFLRM
jgi:hypothetical protein